MKILIVGGNSSLGIALKRVLSAYHEVITAGRNNCDIVLDLGNSLKEIYLPNEIDVVVHTAAHFGGKKAEEIRECEKVNVEGVLRVCEAAVKAGVKHFILVSSIFATLKEDSDFFGIYALSKKHSEEAAKYFCKTFKLPLTIVRPSQIYGNEEIFRRHQPFFYDITDKAQNGDDILIYGSHDALRNYIHIDDLVTIISLIIDNKVEGVYSCMHTHDLSYSQIAQAALSAFNSKGAVRFLNEKAGIQDNIFEKDNLLYDQINFYPKISIEEGMKFIAKHRNTT